MEGLRTKTKTANIIGNPVYLIPRNLGKLAIR